MHSGRFEPYISTPLHVASLYQVGYIICRGSSRLALKDVANIFAILAVNRDQGLHSQG